MPLDQRTANEVYPLGFMDVREAFDIGKEVPLFVPLGKHFPSPWHFLPRSGLANQGESHYTLRRTLSNSSRSTTKATNVLHRFFDRK